MHRKVAIPVDNLSLPRVFSRTPASLFQLPADAFRNSGQGIARPGGGFWWICGEIRRDVRTEALTFRSNDPSEMIWRMTLERQMQRSARHSPLKLYDVGELETLIHGGEMATAALSRALQRKSWGVSGG